MVYCVVYCRYTDDYDSHLNCNDDPTCAVVSQMTADDVRLGTLYTNRKPNANTKLFVKIAGYKSFFVGPLIPLFGLLETSPLGLKARVGSLIYTWRRRT